MIARSEACGALAQVISRLHDRRLLPCRLVDERISQLIDQGHEVVGSHRSPENAERLRALGAEPVALDLLDARAVRKVVLVARPDAIVHQATALKERPRIWSAS